LQLPADELAKVREERDEAKLRVGNLAMRCLNVRDALVAYHGSKLQSACDRLDEMASQVNSPDLIRDLEEASKQLDHETVKRIESRLATEQKYYQQQLTTAQARIDEMEKHNKALEQNLQAARDDYAELERERDTIIDSLPEEHRQHTTGIIESVKRLVKSEGGCAERATVAEAERDKLREALAKLTLKWRMDDFNGKNFPTKREAADEVEAALREPADDTLAVAERSKAEVEQIVGERDKLRAAVEKLNTWFAVWGSNSERAKLREIVDPATTF
jgi:DNA repair exonuclease SbcCD ATPase subunit